MPLVVARLRRKFSKFHVNEGREDEKMILITFSFSELRYRLLEFHSVMYVNAMPVLGMTGN